MTPIEPMSGLRNNLNQSSQNKHNNKNNKQDIAKLDTFSSEEIIKQKATEEELMYQIELHKKVQDLKSKGNNAWKYLSIDLKDNILINLVIPDDYITMYPAPKQWYIYA